MYFVGLSVLVLISWLSSSAQAEELQPISLEQAIHLALRFNASLQMAHLQRVLQQFNVRVIKNQYEWHYALNTAGQYQWQNGSGSSFTAQPSANLLLASGATVNASVNHSMADWHEQTSTQLTLTQPLWRGFGPRLRLSPLADAYDQQRINALVYKQHVMNTIMQIIADYEHVLLAKQAMRIQQNTLATVQQRMQDTAIQIQAGVIPASDAIQSQTDWVEAKLQYQSAQQAYLQSRSLWLNDLGLSPHAAIEVIDALPRVPTSLPSYAASKRQALTNDSGYQILLIHQVLDQRGLLRAQDNQRAQWNLTASNTLSHASSTSLSLSGAITFDDLNAQQEVLAAQLQVQQDQLQLQDQQWTVENTTLTLLNQLNALQRQLDLAQQAVQQQRHALAITVEKKHFGLSSALDVSTQQKNLTQALLTYQNLQIHDHLAWWQLRRLTGQILQDFAITIHY